MYKHMRAHTSLAGVGLQAQTKGVKLIDEDGLFSLVKASQPFVPADAPASATAAAAAAVPAAAAPTQGASFYAGASTSKPAAAKASAKASTSKSAYAATGSATPGTLREQAFCAGRMRACCPVLHGQGLDASVRELRADTDSSTKAQPTK